MYQSWKNWSLKIGQKQQHTSPSNEDNRKTPIHTLDPDFSAGCNLLAKYELDWQAIHNANEENIGKSEIVAELIEKLQEDMKTKCVVMNDIAALTSGMHQLKENLRHSTQTIDEIMSSGDELERRLEQLEDICEECDFYELVLQKQCELTRYKQKTVAELEAYRKRIASVHEDKIRQHEERLKAIQRERQAVFDEAFRSDLEEYKTTGSLPKIDKPDTHHLALEEVVLDVDTKDSLENFLNG